MSFGEFSVERTGGDSFEVMIMDYDWRLSGRIWRGLVEMASAMGVFFGVGCYYCEAFSSREVILFTGFEVECWGGRRNWRVFDIFRACQASGCMCSLGFYCSFAGRSIVDLRSVV